MAVGQKGTATAKNAPVKPRTPAQKAAATGRPKNKSTAAEKQEAKRERKARELKTPQAVKDKRAERAAALAEKRNGGKAGGKGGKGGKAAAGGLTGAERKAALAKWRAEGKKLRDAKVKAVASVKAKQQKALAALRKKNASVVKKTVAAAKSAIKKAAMPFTKQLTAHGKKRPGGPAKKRIKPAAPVAA
jgi:hypothetical protein